MSTSYTRFNIQDLPLEENPSGTDLLEVAVATENGYVMKRETAAAIADAIVNDYEYTQDLNTTSKKITGAINEVMSAKADITSLATVATSGAYSDLSGKPTIDTAFDTTSTNAVENRAVASEINSIKSDITVEGSASGDIATFGDGSDNPLKELTISIVATQSGSGDPSPTNIRPISGFSAVDIGDISDTEKVTYFKGLLDGTYAFIDMGNLTYEYSSSNGIFMCKIAPYFGSGGTAKYQGYGISTLYTRQNVPLTNPPDMSFYVSNSSAHPILRLTNSNYIDADAFKSAMSGTYLIIELATPTTPTITPTTFNTLVSAFGLQGWLVQINWQSTAGTVYGGTLNVKTGELTVTNRKILGGAATWQIQESSLRVYYTSSFNTIKKEGNSNIICDSYATSNATTVTNMNNLTIKGRASDGNIYIRNTNYTSLEDFTSAVANVEIMFKLKTSVTYQLTPTEIRSLLGINNIWADCGSITELKYTRDLNLCINDIISRLEALEGGSNTRSLSVSSVLTKSLTSDSDTAESKIEEETEEETKEEAQKNER